MHEDLAAKCKRDFEDLIAQLEERDTLVQEAEIMNKFIAAHLRVQNMRHSYEQAQGAKHKGKMREDHVPAGKVREGSRPSGRVGVEWRGEWEEPCKGLLGRTLCRQWSQPPLVI